MSLPRIRLKKGEDRRIRAGHPWIFSNEIDTKLTPLKSFTPGQEVLVEAHDKSVLGTAYLNPHSLIAGRLFSRDPDTRLDLNFFKEKFQAALSLRERLFDQPFYRLVFSEGDGLPGLVIDRFAQDFVVQINTAGMEQKQILIQEALCSLFPDIHSILLRNDSQVREHEGLTQTITPLLGHPPEIIRLQENSATFSVPLWRGQKTGWFYDHRQNRARLAPYVPQRRVLDVFSYLGAWGIQAALGGATQVDCIESSALASGFILENAKLNHVHSQLNVITADAFDAMKQLLKDKKNYDVIILDPPAFVKKLKDRKEGLIAYQRLNELALKLLSPDGILVSCSCSMHVQFGDLMQLMQRLQFRNQETLQLLERGHQGPDHPIHIAIPETDYLKTVIVRKMKQER